MLAHINRLASDGFEGRAPGTPGEDSTVAYLTSQFQALGLTPGNPDGRWVQNVEMIGFTGRPSASYAIGGQTVQLGFPDDFVAVSRHDAPEINVRNSELVFVGYGIVAPEYGWDDYKGADVRGKTLVMLVNDPPIPDPNDSTQLDSTMFRGRAMTYYGRWTYKYEIATQKGVKSEINLVTLMQKRVTVTGSTLRPRSVAQNAVIADALRAHVWPLLDAGKVRPLIHAMMPLEHAAEAHRVMESGVHIGKIVLAI